MKSTRCRLESRKGTSFGGDHGRDDAPLLFDEVVPLDLDLLRYGSCRREQHEHHIGGFEAALYFEVPVRAVREVL